jgi:NAD(P)-dependent dehydrogenase (short-subunit alcohol dehydrogenase family)
MRIDEHGVAVITGATAGVERATSRLFAHREASVALQRLGPAPAQHSISKSPLDSKSMFL